MSRRLIALFVLMIPMVLSSSPAPASPGIDLTYSTVSGVVALAPSAAHNWPLRLVAPDYNNRNTSNNPSPQNTPSVAINPVNYFTIVGGFNDYRAAANNDANCGYTRSSDRGDTWSSGILMGITRGNGGPLDYDAAGDPSIYYAANGTVYYTCLAFDRSFGRSALVILHSGDGGVTWSTPSVIVQSDTADVFHDMEKLAIDTSSTSPYSGRMYVQWTEYTNTFLTSKMYITYSSDGGVTWAAPILLSGTQTDAAGASPAVGPDGTVYAFWCSPCSGSTVKIWLSKSTSGGVTWGLPSGIGTFTGVPNPLPGNLLRVNNFPSGAANPANGQVYVVYNDYSSGNADIKARTSTDQGQTWALAVTANKRLADDQFMPVVAASADGPVWICYYDQSYNTMNWLDVTCVRSLTGRNFSFASRANTRGSFDPAYDGFGGVWMGDYLGMSLGPGSDLPRTLWTSTIAGNAEIYTSNPSQ